MITRMAAGEKGSRWAVNAMVRGGALSLSGLWRWAVVPRDLSASGQTPINRFLAPFVKRSSAVYYGGLAMLFHRL